MAVLDAAESDRPVVVGAAEGGPIALLFAASVPARTEALVLINTGLRFVQTEGYRFGFPAKDWRPDLTDTLQTWQSGEGAEAHIVAARHDFWWRDWYVRCRRAQLAPTAGLALLHMIGQLDVRDVLPAVRPSTLILHRQLNRWWPIEGARWMAAQLPNATLVELEGAEPVVGRGH